MSGATLRGPRVVGPCTEQLLRSRPICNQKRQIRLPAARRRRSAAMAGLPHEWEGYAVAKLKIGHLFEPAQFPAENAGGQGLIVSKIRRRLLAIVRIDALRSCDPRHGTDRSVPV